MNKFIRTGSILDKIIDNKVLEVEAIKQEISLSKVRDLAENAPPAKDFIGALRKDTVALIAEVKKASPSKGILIENFDPLALAQTYAENGASAISVLTDENFFQGKLTYLKEISKTVDIPTLRKDFIIDPYQVYEARMAGASAVLLIVAALDDSQLADLHSLINELGMSGLVEVHNEEELERAMMVEAPLIGVNNRDLKTFDVDLSTTERLAHLMPDTVTLVAESGIKSGADVVRMGAMGAHAVLVGEGIVTAENIVSAVHEYSSQKRG